MHSCANKIINLFTCKKPHSKGVMPDDALVANPQKLCYVIKQATREGSVGQLMSDTDVVKTEAVLCHQTGHSRGISRSVNVRYRCC